MTSPDLLPKKRIGFLSFGHWQPANGSLTQTARDAHVQTVELAVAAEELGIDGAFVRVHHFARQLSAPFPLLAAIGVRTSRIEIGTAVIDMRYENPLYMAEEAAAADVLSGGRLQLGISRGSPEPAYRGADAFGYVPPEGMSDAELARRKTELFRAAIAGAGVVHADAGGAPAAAALPVQPLSPGLYRPHLVGAGHAGNCAVGRRAGHEPDELDPAPRGHLGAVRRAPGRADRALPRNVECGGPRPGPASLGQPQRDADHLGPRPPRFFGRESGRPGRLPRRRARRFGRTYTGEPDIIAAELAEDAAVAAADTILLTVPEPARRRVQRPVAETIARDVAPAIGWSPAGSEPAPAER